MFRVPRSAFRVVFVLLLAARAEAQVDPSSPWRTLHTPHFRIHFRPAYRTAAPTEPREADRANALLPSRLHPPRGRAARRRGEATAAPKGFLRGFPPVASTLLPPDP